MDFKLETKGFLPGGDGHLHAADRRVVQAASMPSMLMPRMK
jgi:hypothetical protein